MHHKHFDREGTRLYRKSAELDKYAVLSRPSRKALSPEEGLRAYEAHQKARGEKRSRKQVQEAQRAEFMAYAKARHGRN